ncbi:MAG: hypothetical protein ACLQBY_15925 [Solirubrobacteraceae bacterium]
MGRRRRTQVLLWFALTLGVFALGHAWSPASSLAAAAARHAGGKPRKPAKAPPAEVTLTPTLTAAPGASVTMPPVGLSIEYPVMAEDLGSEACPPSALATELLRLGSPPLELAGVSQDMTAPSGALSGSPTSWETATLYSLPASFWSQLHCLLMTAKDPLTVGLNMRTGNLSWAAQMAAEAQSAATDGVSFSLGNEPDLYGLPNYASLDKPLAGEEAAAANLYVSLATYLRPAIGSAPLVGPELARPADWRFALPHVLEQLHEQTVGVHLYPLTACVTPRAVTIGGLLSPQAADGPARLAWVVSDARAAGAAAIISEANSASCGGLAGVSDSPAAAVWAVRFVLSALKTGFGEVRFHFSGNSYDPFVVRGAEVLTRPLESALVALNQWLAPGSSLRTVPGVRGLLATAVGEPGGGILLILDNERAQARPVLLRDAYHVDTAMLSPVRAGLQTATLSSARGRIRLSVPENSVLAVSTTPSVAAPAP